ncbi:ATP-binding protein [Campylobacter geochelonis]|uniref:Type IV secretory pathway, VirB4 components n=1 Tax=Campylobacter geochelonis TaxID=1780362 RepID=A0A128EAA6_9BACT|nr:DUF87 domain-containing protein [Campylobacter geochelonis]QKF70645.1 YjgR domain-containing protein [Campylobacter geochelonis]CZE45869.1 Type IV secretory pathway%2C VirB4 components [Campylobacter geochelonis]
MKNLQENLKLFYLGLKNSNEPYLYKNKDLTTHATIIGMTGSGKTGLGITLLEEACIDNIPSIIIDPKGDMTNLALAFSDMKKEDFLPFMDANEAASKGVSVEKMAEDTARMWKKGIEDSYQSLDRVKFFKDSADFRIYTPKGSAGLGVSLLSDFKAPVGLNDEELNSYALSITSSVLSLVGADTQNESSPDMLLVQTIFLTNFKNGKNVAIADLINQIATPPFEKVGVFDINTFYPSDKRMALAMKINALVASPSFAKWCEGERLDISKMLFDDNGKARCNIFTISHLSDSERMFFVTILLNEIIRWMRTTEGTSSLRAILYMDEIFGFFPPTSNPPSKTPMLTLLKQARAFGVGCVLSTQNPVDLDYKGLSNIGTWFIGRLQTAQDKERVISGLTGINDSSMDKNELLELISNLKKRSFLVKNINEDALEVISTRWALSYLKGPLSSEQISNLMSEKKSSKTSKATLNLSLENAKPIISPNIKELFSYSFSLDLEPYLWGVAKARYVTKEFEYIKDINLAFLLDGASQTQWSQASEGLEFSTQETAKENSKFAHLPNYIASKKDLKDEAKNLKEYIYRNEKLELFSALDMTSKPDESKDRFLLRLHDKCNEILELETSKFDEKFKKEQAKFEIKLKKAYEKLEKEKSDVKAKGLDAIISIGSTILGAFFGGKTLSRTNMGKAATSARSAGRVLDERADVKLAQEAIETIEADIQKLSDSANEQLEALKDRYNIRNLEINSVQISLKKSDIFDEEVVLLWKS